MTSAVLVVEPSKICVYIYNTQKRRMDILFLYIGYHRMSKQNDSHGSLRSEIQALGL